jgi:hypothetical protein
VKAGIHGTPSQSHASPGDEGAWIRKNPRCDERELVKKTREGFNMAQHTDSDRRRSADATRPGAAPNAEDVARRAYELYEARGGEPGADLDDWLKAESELRTLRKANAVKTA